MLALWVWVHIWNGELILHSEIPTFIFQEMKTQSHFNFGKRQRHPFQWPKRNIFLAPKHKFSLKILSIFSSQLLILILFTKVVLNHCWQQPSVLDILLLRSHRWEIHRTWNKTTYYPWFSTEAGLDELQGPFWFWGMVIKKDFYKV